VLSLDVMDISGEQQRDITHNILKTRLEKGGKVIPGSHTSELGSELDRQNAPMPDGYCGSCYGADPPDGSILLFILSYMLTPRPCRWLL
jgi:endoplasmic reticulum-Golgi intermediate compartment protein 3